MLFSFIVALFTLASSSVFAKHHHSRHHHSHHHELPNPVVCAQELAAITYQPKVCGVDFLKSLASSVVVEASALFGSNNLVFNFLSGQLDQFSVGFAIYDAMGRQNVEKSAPSNPAPELAFSHAFQLAYTQGMGSDSFVSGGNTYYGVAVRVLNSDGQFAVLYVYALKSALPTIC